jgi:PPP family 3-phenylpropionic acid transporter
MAVASGYLAVCAVIGVQIPFFPLFLADRGLGPAAISLALALPLAIRLAAMPLAGVYSDRLGAPRTVLFWLAILAAAGFALIGAAPGVISILLAIGLSAVFWTPVFPLLEAYTLRLANIGAVDYGRVRLWGSASFIAANLAGGYLLDWVPAGAIAWLIAGCIFLFVLASRTLPPLERPLADETEFLPGLPKRVVFLGVAAAACVQASHAMLYGFSSLQWKQEGIEPSTIGLLWSIGVGAEIVLFYGGTRIAGKIPALFLIAAGGVAAMLRFSAFAFDPPLALIVPLQLLHGLTYGATHLGLMTLIRENAPAHRSGRAQTFSSAMLGAVMALATIAAGPLYARWGAGAYGAFAVLGAAGALIALIAIVQPQSSGSGGNTAAPS